MQEILFVDHRRLDNCVMQITNSDTDRELVGKFSGTLKTTGPEIGVGLDQKEKTRRLIDQLRILQRHLLDSDKVQSSRPSRDDRQSPWVMEQIEATRVVVPSKQLESGIAPSFAFWWAAAPENSSDGSGIGPGPLCLLEDWRSEKERDDGSPVFFAKVSTYTLMQSLVHYTRGAIEKSVMDKFLPDNPRPPDDRFSDDSDHPLSLKEYYNVKGRLCYEFATNPVPLVKSWGCPPPTTRKIHTLYYIREVGRDSTSSHMRVSTFGYPIWIVADSSL